MIVRRTSEEAQPGAPVFGLNGLRAPRRRDAVTPQPPQSVSVLTLHRISVTIQKFSPKIPIITIMNYTAPYSNEEAISQLHRQKIKHEAV